MEIFRSVDREAELTKPFSIQDSLPKDHMARYVVDIVESLDLSAFEEKYAGRGQKAYPPSMLLALFIYAYINGIFSTRKIEQATYDSIPFLYIACNLHPDHDTLATFRKRFKEEFQDVFVQVLMIAYENGLSRFGTVSLDGSKLHANASRHSALSYEHAEKFATQLKNEVKELFDLAEEAQSVPQGLDIPKEIEIREARLAAIAEAKKKIEARAQERFEREDAEYQAKIAAREAKEAATGKKRAAKRQPRPRLARARRIRSI